jgi:hypothetical protein
MRSPLATGCAVPVRGGREGREEVGQTWQGDRGREQRLAEWRWRASAVRHSDQRRGAPGATHRRRRVSAPVDVDVRTIGDGAQTLGDGVMR